MKPPAILIVDDREENLLALERILDRAGVEIVKATNGNEALKACLHRQFAVALLDVNMPGMSGYELAELMRGDRSICNTPIIFLTAAYSQEDHIFKGYSAGAIDYLIKPVNPSVLLSKVGIFVEMQRQREELLRSERLYRAVVENISDGIAVVGKEGEVIAMNEAFRHLHGVDTLSSIHDFRRRFERMFCDATSHTGCPFRTALEGAAVGPIELQVCCRETGASFFGSYSAIPLRTADGSIDKIVLTVRDVSAERQALSRIRSEVDLRTAELQEAVAKLEQEMACRQEAERQLQHAQKLESVGSLAGGIAHDFNNLLTAIRGYSDIARDAAQDEEVRSWLSEVVAAADRAKELTQKILAFSRQQVLQMKPVSVTELLEGILKFLGRVLPENIHVTADPVPPNLLIFADYAQIEQVITNIIINARDAMPEGGEITVTTERAAFSDAEAPFHGLETGGEYVAIEISDNGHGIEPETIERIFDPFFTTKAAGKGTGLGLAIAYGVTRQHRGGITVESEPEKGAVFTIFLPLMKEQRTEGQEPAPASTPGGNEVILLVEDDAAVIEYLSVVLVKAGYQVVTARNGAEGIPAVLDRAVDLVVSDVMMPTMNGIEMYREMKKLRPHLKIVFVSGYSADHLSSRDGVLEEGAAFLQKPVARETLLRTVREVLDSGQ